MSLRYEQYQSLRRTRKLLCTLIRARQKDLRIGELRKEASACLRHFPYLTEQGQPIWSKDEFTEDAVF